MMTKRLRAAVVGLGVVAALSPVSISTSAGVMVQTACAEGTCCKEAGSDCIINGILTENAYKAAKPGPCSGQNES